LAPRQSAGEARGLRGRAALGVIVGAFGYSAAFAVGAFTALASI
jgi:hypothetical protein